jgi:hypothetical protein
MTIRAGVLAAAAFALYAAPTRAVEQSVIEKAIERGVKFLRQMQLRDGTWRHTLPEVTLGATALCGLTLLECSASPDDDAVKKAASIVRKAAPSLGWTYGISLSILFLDRLGDPSDVPLIESLAVRLLAGQKSSGGWTYMCPLPSPEELRRLQALVEQREAALEARRDLRDLPKRGVSVGDKTIKDVTPQVQAQIRQIESTTPPAGETDNSNTQFAALALWVAQRQGIPVGTAMARMEQRFRATQMPDGGWTYLPGVAIPDASKGVTSGDYQGANPGQPTYGSSATMTCAGILAVAISHGTGKSKRTPEQDKTLRDGLRALSTAIDQPVGDHPELIPRAAGKSYYFLWSVERVCVILDLDTIDKKDWYTWGAEILLKNQQDHGAWVGAYADHGCADTCFALLFLRRSNLARDLTARIKGRIKDEHILRGSVGAPKGMPKALKPGIEDSDKARVDGPRPNPNTSAAAEPKKAPDSTPPAPGTSASLAEELLKARDGEREAILEKFRMGKGVEFTEALVNAIRQLGGDARKQARETLALRLARMKAETLAEYLQDEEAEIRSAAALACAKKQLKPEIPQIIPLLRDPERIVSSAARDALKQLTGRDLGDSAEAWDAWWKKQGKP